MDLVSTVENYGRALTVEELAELTAISSKTIYRLIRIKKIPAFRIGTLIRLDPANTAEWLRSRFS